MLFSFSGGDIIFYRVAVKSMGKWMLVGPAYNNSLDAHTYRERVFPGLGLEQCTIIQYTSEDAAYALINAWNTEHPPSTKPIEKRDEQKEEAERRKFENSLNYVRFLVQKGILNEGV